MSSKINNLTITLILASCCIFPSSHAEESRGPEIVFSAGREGGGYWGVAQRMKAVSAESELSVLVKESAGSIQNLDRLADPGSAVNLTLAQADAIEYYLKDHPDLANHIMDFQWMRIYPTDR